MTLQKGKKNLKIQIEGRFTVISDVQQLEADVGSSSTAEQVTEK